MSTLHKLYQETHTTIEKAIRDDQLRAGAEINEQNVVNIASQLILYEFEMAAVEVARKKIENDNGKLFERCLLGGALIGGAALGVSGLALGVIAGVVGGNVLADVCGKKTQVRAMRGVNEDMAAQGFCPPYHPNAKEMPEVYAVALQSLACDAQFIERMRKHVAKAHVHYGYT